MHTTKNLLHGLALVALLFVAHAEAQLTINVETSSGRTLPIAIAPFAMEAEAPQNITPLIADNPVPQASVNCRPTPRT
jgi:hypothetical protein